MPKGKKAPGSTSAEHRSRKSSRIKLTPEKEEAFVSRRAATLERMGVPSAVAIKLASGTLTHIKKVLSERNRSAVGRNELEELKSEHREIQNRLKRWNKALDRARTHSARYSRAMMLAKGPEDIARLAVAYMPKEFGSHGLVMLKHGRKWVGYMSPLDASPGTKTRKPFQFEMPSLPKRGLWSMSGKVADFTSARKESLPDEVVSALGGVGRVAVQRVGENGYMMIFDPDANINGSLFTRLNRRVLAAKSRLATLSAEKKTIAAERRATEATMLADLSRDMALQGLLIPSIAHEIKTPLDTIGRKADELSSDPTLPPSHKASAEKISAKTNEVKGIMAQMRELPNISKHMKEIDPNIFLRWSLDAGLLDYLNKKGVKVDNQSFFESLINSFQTNRAGSSRNPLSMSLGSVPHARISELHLDRVIANLMRNAADAVEDSDVKRIRLSTKTVKKKGRNFVRIAVSDTGPGIPESARKNVFEPNFTTKAEKGMGVGLALTKWIVDEHGGNLHFKTSTKKGKSGTTFYVDLPAIET